MPTKLRRISISLPPELDESLARFSRLTNSSQASFVVECLQGNISVIDGISDAIEAAMNGNKGLADNILQTNVDSIKSELEGVLNKED